MSQSEQNGELLIRLDERMGNIQQELSHIQADLTKLREELKKDYVLKTEFTVVRALVFGATGLILVAVLVALIATVVTR